MAQVSAALAPQNRMRKKKLPTPAGTKRLALAFVVMSTANVLSNLGGRGFTKTNAEISGMNPTYLTPDGPTFAIWGPIYLFELLALAEIAMGSGNYYLPRREAAMSSLAIAFLLNAMWLVAFAQELYSLSLAVMICYLLALIRTYMDIDMIHDTDIFLPVGVSANLAWVCVATCLNVLIALARADVGDGVLILPQPAGSPFLAILASAALTIIALTVLVARFDWPFAATIAWALWGLRRGQEGVPDVARVAGASALVCVCAASAAVLYLPRHSKPTGKTMPRITHQQKDGADVGAKFRKAADSVAKLENITNENKDRLHALYQCATVGPATGPRPGAIDYVGRRKYDAWAELKDMDKNTAMKRYCDIADELLAASTPPSQLEEAPSAENRAKFDAAVKMIQSLPKKGPFRVSTADKLKMYGLFKQANEGDNATPKPGFGAFEAKYKWDAWQANKGMKKGQAMRNYVELADDLIAQARAAGCEVPT